MDRIEWLGLVASLLTTTAYLPQVAKTWKTRSAEDFSLSTLIMLVAGVLLWTIYGVLRAAPAVWFGNGVTVMLAAFILGIKVRGMQPSLGPGYCFPARYSAKQRG